MFLAFLDLLPHAAFHFMQSYSGWICPISLYHISALPSICVVWNSPWLLKNGIQNGIHFFARQRERTKKYIKYIENPI